MSEDELKKNFLNCFMDLQRAAISFYQNPQGKTHLIFLNHAQGILEKIKDEKARHFVAIISQLKDKTSHPSEKQKKYLADEILTAGILLK